MVSTGGFGRGSLIPTMDDLGNTGATLHLEAGVPHDLSLTASSSVRVEPGGVNTEGDPLQIRLAWITPEGREASVEEAAGAAREATVVVLFAHQEGTEGADRPSLSLPGVQDDLIARVAQANPNTVVVMNTGAPTLMPWIEEVGAVLQMWYPGQEGGEATAALLLGEANPRGKLPVTFPRDESRHATGDPRRYPGVDGHAAHDEGLMVGYRWFDEQGVDPLFPFGHGLSYTTFSYSDLTVRPEGEGFEVSFTLANAGGMAGIEVPQLYLGPPDSPPVPMAPSALVDFRTVELAPRESRRVTLEIGDRALSYWSEAEEAWVVAPGTRSVSVGSSSRDIHLRGVTGG
jgi:beta-glucosidase